MVSDQRIFFQIKAPVSPQLGIDDFANDEEVQARLGKGVKCLKRDALERVDWNPEQLRLTLVGSDRSIHIAFRESLAELGDSVFRELVSHLPEMGPIEETQQAFFDRHASAVLNLCGFSLAALILWWMQTTDDPLDYEGRRKGFFELAKAFVALSGLWGVLGVAFLGVGVATRKYLHREKNPVPMFSASRT